MSDELLHEFLSESWENLTQLDTEIVELEKQPDDIERIASIFRTIHTIKGTCGFIGLDRLGAVAHSAENVLGRMRAGELGVDPSSVSLVLEAVDRIKELLVKIEETGAEPDLDSSDLIRKLDLLASIPDAFKGQESDQCEPTPSQVVGESTCASPTPQDSSDANPTTMPATDSDSAPPEVARASETAPIEASEESGTSPRKGVADLSIRVNVDVLDSLMNLVGELVLTRNQLLQLVRGDQESRYTTPIVHLNRVTTDLQEGVMKTRMQPIGNAWNKLPRLVRDLSNVTGKQIELEMSGAETELDRTVLDAIKDPLTHMVRNSADHGVEDPATRRANGKPELGTIQLSACHEGGHVVICIADDGGGINIEKVRNKALRQGLLDEATLSRMSDHETLQLIFRPGFSTAEQVSSVSGRGVGMDVVRTQIERIGGTVDLSSSPGAGTTIKIKIPLTLAIISALVVESGGESFAIPQLGVVELVRLAEEDRGRIEWIHDRPVFRLRDRLLPLVQLSEILELENRSLRDCEEVNIVVVQVGEEQFGLVVNEVFDTEEIVVKPVGRLLKELGVYQGTTILGDGRVIMILDVTGIASRFGGLSNGVEEADSADATDVRSGHESTTTSLLLFDPGDGSQMAVPLSLVARLEEVPSEAIERAGNQLVVQYRGDLLPLLAISGTGQAEGAEIQPVIVFTEGRNSMGLLVREIKDVLEESLVIRMQRGRPGIAGTAIVDGAATEVIDTRHFLLQAHPDWFASPEHEIDQRLVLLVDRSPFFRQLAVNSLPANDVHVTAVAGLEEGVELYSAGRRFDAVIVEIELSDADGVESLLRSASVEPYSTTPMLGLTRVLNDEVQRLAADAGVSRVMAKFDPDAVTTAIEQMCFESTRVQEAV